LFGSDLVRVCSDGSCVTRRLRKLNEGAVLCEKQSGQFGFSSKR
jgi:hypothetical protein